MYNFKEIEQKWQRAWAESGVFGFDFASDKPKYYVLEMLPYPSGNLHMGHVRNYTIGDIMARYKRMRGFNVVHPMGWDAFGLPAENAAIEGGMHPETWTKANIGNMKKQMEKVGFSYDWGLEVATCDPSYYKHEQQMFIDLYNKGLVYQKETFVNWDPVDNTVLANEQVVEGRGWRSGALVEKRSLRQWFLKISTYADSLLVDIDKLDWPEKVKLMQTNWIGKSSGAELDFVCQGGDKIKIYTTRPETLFGASFVAVSPMHPLAEKLSKTDLNVAQFVEGCKIGGTSEEELSKKEKLGLNTGVMATLDLCCGVVINVPVFIANFVLMDYGTGAIFGCPAHDERDAEFAKKYDLPFNVVVGDDGCMVSSGFLNNMPADKAKSAMIDHLQKNSIGSEKINYRLRDWGVSRQRYWGCPIPFVYCEDCGVVAETKLPVELPKDVDFSESGNPLERHPTWSSCLCPQCKKPSKRETDTLDTFFESSWYFLRYVSPGCDTAFKKDDVNRLMPVDVYIGGVEHAVMHLLYARFFTKALKTLGYLDFEEPFSRLLTQGMVCHRAYQSDVGRWLFPDEVEDKFGKFFEHSTGKEVFDRGVIKMSKSKKNVVDPIRILDSYGADTARFFMVSDTPPDRDLEWNTDAIDAIFKYIGRLYALSAKCGVCAKRDADVESAGRLEVAMHRAIRDAEDAIESWQLNKLVSSVRTFSNVIEESIGNVDCKKALEVLCCLIAPVMPHLAEEMWLTMGHKNLIASQPWPSFDATKLELSHANVAVQINGKLRATFVIDKSADEEAHKKAALGVQKVRQYIGDSEIKKAIVVKGKIVNFIV